MTVSEVARRLQQSERMVRDKIASGQLPAVKIGTGPRVPLRVDPAELVQWLTSSHIRSVERRKTPTVQGTRVRRRPWGEER